MGEGYVRTREDYQKIIDECNKQFKLMENTKKQMDIAAEFQTVTLKYAEEKIKEFPVPSEEKKEEEKMPLGVG